MDWKISNALSRDVERQHLNKILAEIRAAINSSSSGTTTTNVIEHTTTRYAVARFNLTLDGDVTGTAEVDGLNDVIITTTLGDLDFVEEAPLDAQAYWRSGGEWEAVDGALTDLTSIEGNGFTVIYEDAEHDRRWVTREIEGTLNNIIVSDGDGVAANPVINLAAVTDSNTGTLQGITVDGFGRTTGTTDATITGTLNRIFVANGNAAAGPPTIDIDAAYVGQTSITTLGTITTGVWNGTAIDLANYVSGNLAVSHLNSGTGAAAGTFWQGDGTWGTPTGTYTDAMARAAVVIDSIADSDTDHAPSRNAVFDALALKQDLDTQLSSLAALVYTGNAGKFVRVNAGETDFELASVSTGSSPLTTKGDIYTYSTVDDRLPIGSNGYVLSADSGEATGLKWIPAPSSTLADGDYGDITVSGTGTVMTIDNSAVTLAKIQDIGTFEVLARQAGGFGPPERIAVGGSLDMVGGTLGRAALTGDVTAGFDLNTTTLATVNSDVGTYGSATQVGQFTVNGKGLITAASNVAISVTSSAVTDFNEAAQDAINTAFAAGTHTGFTSTYTDASNKFDFAVTAAPEVSFSVNQTTHGFSVGHTIQYNGTSWATADRDADATVADAIVSAVADANNFTALMVGKVTLTTGQWDSRTSDSGGLTAGEYYWLSSTAGGLTKTQPTSGIAQCIGVALSTTVMLVNIGEAVNVVAANQNLVDIAAISGANDDIIQRKAGAWTNRTVAQYKADLSLTNVTNDAQTKSAIVPNTTPSAGQLLVGNAGGTAYAPVSASGDVTVSSTGAITIGNDKVTYAKMQNVSATDKVLGRSTAGAGDVEELACTAGGRALINSAGTADTFPRFSAANTVTLTPFATGTYTPTLTNTTNVAASTAYICTYFRINDIVHVSGRVDIDITTGGAASLLGMSLPIASNLAAAADLSGVAAVEGGAVCSIAIKADTTNDRASFQWFASADTVNRGFHFTFTYRVI
jgi:hypothetical protein